MKTPPKYRSSEVQEQWMKKGLDVFKSNEYIATIVKSEFLQSEPARMVNIREGVMQFSEDSIRFEAALDTEEGPKTVEGSVLPRPESTDIQSGPMNRWQFSLDGADEAIRFAYDSLLPAEGLKTISTIWEHLDRTSELAAARSRLLMGKMNRPPLADLPGWFTDQERGLLDQDEGELAANPLAIESSRLLVRAALASVDDNNELEAELETGPLGRVTIDWHIPGSRFQWMIEAVDQPWPSVIVYQLAHRADGDRSTAPETRVFHNAYDATESFAEFVHGK